MSITSCHSDVWHLNELWSSYFTLTLTFKSSWKLRDRPYERGESQSAGGTSGTYQRHMRTMRSCIREATVPMKGVSHNVPETHQGHVRDMRTMCSWGDFVACDRPYDRMSRRVPEAHQGHVRNTSKTHENCVCPWCGRPYEMMSRNVHIVFVLCDLWFVICKISRSFCNLWFVRSHDLFVICDL